MPTISSRSPKIYYETSGNGPAVVLLHGFLCDGSLFRHQVAALQTSYRLLNIDLRGHGRSGPAEGPFSVYDLVDDVCAVLDAEAVGSAVWVGLSLGGFVALRAALTQPRRVRALVLMGTEAGAQSGLKKMQDWGLKLALKTVGPKPVVPAVLSAMLGKTSMRTKPALVEEYRRQFLAMRVDSVCLGIDAAMQRDDLVGHLQAIRCPTLVLVGDEDVPLPIARSTLICDGITGATLGVIAGAGHLSAIEQPTAVNEEMRLFMARLA